MNSAAAPYEQLLELIEQQLALAGEARYDELIELGAERAEFVAGLLATPPACAHDALERASILQQRLTIELLRGREQRLLALSRLERARRAALGYAPPTFTTPRLLASA
jgi:hypothetical protein